MKRIGRLACLLLAAWLAAGLAHAGKLKLVEVVTSPERTRLLQSQLAEFQKANPATSVELITIPWDGAFEKVLVMFKSGQIPDVLEMPDRWTMLYAKGRQLEPLDPWLKNSQELASLQKSVLEVARFGTDKTYTIPYGFYMKALFYNKKLLARAGVAPPRTQEEFERAVAAVSTKVPGKYGYCLRGGKGGAFEWLGHPSTYGGTGTWFDKDGNSLYATPAMQRGMQMVVDFYKRGYAPKESLSWGYNELVTGFYSGTCAMLEQDADALLGIQDKMDKQDFGVVPVPLGDNGKGYPNTGFAGWSLTRASANKDEAWKLIQFLSAARQNLAWAKVVGVLPIHQGAEADPAFAGERWAAWFEQLKHPEKYQLLIPPVNLPEWGVMYDKTMVENGQDMLLGKRSVADVARQWADTLTAAQRKFNSTAVR
jgi:multiple sugar transport system substrate-binding protein